MRILTLFILLFLSVKISGQIYYNTSGELYLGEIKLNTCEYNYLTPVKGKYRIPFSEIAIAPDGRMLGHIGTASSQEQRPYRICELDIRKNTLVDTLINFHYGSSSLTISPQGVCYFGISFAIISMDLATQKIRPINFYGSIPGDIQFMPEDSVLITQAESITPNPPGQWIFKIDLKTGSIDTIMAFPKENRIFGLATLWDYTAKKRRLYGTLGNGYNNIERGINDLVEIDLENKRLVTICDKRPLNYPIIWGMTSDDDVRTQFNIRMDLDPDNSSGRLVDHYLIDTLCLTTLPIADRDASIKSYIGGIDSLVVQIQSGIKHPGQEILELRGIFPGISTSFIGKEKIVLRNLGTASDEAFTDALRSIRYRIEATEVQDGERVVLCNIYKNGIKGDPAMTYLRVRAYARPFAGNDATVQGCEHGSFIDLYKTLGPKAYPGGTWYPALRLNNLLSPDQDTAAHYFYIVKAGDCPADTAQVTVERPLPFPAIGINGIRERQTQIVQLCAGDSITWDISAGLLSAQRYQWENQTRVPRRTFTQPGSHFINIEDYNGCTWVAGITILAANGGKAAKREKVTLRKGEVHVWENQVIRQDTLICRVIPRPGTCDSTYCLEVKFTTTSSRDIKITQESDFYFPGLLHPGEVLNLRSHTHSHAKVLEMEVFDQWGRVLWRGKDFSANDLSRGWNGQASANGLYLALARIQLENGTIELVSGKIVRMQ
ncbi:WD40 repeat domain-containing protein [Haliscomenobacter hydrossis]|nr:WD40 repeat domain-containing protein [Haliscomenobacter hydrossis]